MSFTAKVVWVMVIIVVIGGGYWLWSTRQAEAPSAYAPDITSSASPSDRSNQGLDQDTAAIDAQLSAAASDSSNVGNTLNDRPVAQ